MPAEFDTELLFSTIINSSNKTRINIDECNFSHNIYSVRGVCVLCKINLSIYKLLCNFSGFNWKLQWDNGMNSLNDLHFSEQQYKQLLDGEYWKDNSTYLLMTAIDFVVIGFCKQVRIPNKQSKTTWTQ